MAAMAINWVTGQLADTPTRGLPTRGLDDVWMTLGLDMSQAGQLADYIQLAYWTSHGLDNSRTRRCRQKNEN